MAIGRLTGGQLLVRSLVAEDVHVVFGLPGVQLDWLFDALFDARDAIRVVHTRHEQATAYMADGYARTSGRVGVCLVVPGPGMLNAAAGLATAYACSAPVLCVTGQVDSRAIGGGYGLLHEIPHQARVLASVTSWSACAMAAEDIAPLVREAFTRLRRGRPRPVALELPPDVLEASVADDGRRPTRATVNLAAVDDDALDQAAELLRGAVRPVIYSGGGVLAAGAWDELQGLAELLEAPVVMSVDGRGAVSDRHDLAHTGLTGQALIEDADLVLGIGTRFWYPMRAWRLRPGVRIVRVDADPDEMARHGAPDVAIVGDARTALLGLLERLGGMSTPRPTRRDELRRRKLAAETRLEAYQPQAAYAHALRAAIPDDGITVHDLTQVTFFATVGFPVYAPRTFLGPGYQGTLGSAFPTALGAQVGHPDRAVVAIAGDGGYLYALAELATQRQQALPVVSVVFNDGAYGNVKRTQERVFGGRLIASDLVNPDFLAVARAFGLDAERVDSPPRLEAALRSALRARRPALIEVSVGPMSHAWPTIAAAGGVYPIRLPGLVQVDQVDRAARRVGERALQEVGPDG